MRGSRGARATSSGSDSSESPLRILTRRVVCPAGVSCGPTRGGALMTRPSSPWPKGARCAVMLTFDFDAETLWLARDPKTADLPGVMSQGRYGARVGVPRLLGLLRAEGIRATFYIPGWVAEHHTAEACAIRDAGHEIGHHGYRHDWADPSKPDAERTAFEQGMRALQSVLGVTPRGYRAPAWELTPITLDLVRKHGMFHSSNLMDDVYPYLHPGEPPVVELPVQWVLDDAPYFLMHPRLAPRPMQSPEVIFGVWRDEFRGFYEWGGLFNLACHPQVIGHPSRLLMLRRLIRFVKRHRGVWWATASEVGAHIGGRHPEGGDGVSVRRREPVDVERQGALPEDVQFPGLDGVAGRVEEAVERARSRAPLARRPIPRDASRLGGSSLRAREGHGGAAGQLDVTDPLFDRRAHLAGLGVEDLVAQHEVGGLDVDHAALDVQDVADPKLARVPHVAVRGHAGATPPRRVFRAEPAGLEHAEPRVGDAGEVVGHGEVVVVVHLPTGDGAAVGLEPSAHVDRDQPASILEVHRLHRGLGIARAGRDAGGHGVGDAPHVLGAQLDLQRAQVLLQALPVLGPGDRHDVRAPGEEPRERQLRGGAALLLRDLLEPAHELHVLREVLVPEARVLAAPVALRDVGEALDAPGEEAPPERRVRDEHDAELAQRRERLFRLRTVEQRVFALDRRDRVDLVGAADRPRRGLAEPEEPHFALVHEPGHRADGLLDRALPAHAVLIVGR